MNAFPPDPHTLLIEAAAIAEGLAALAARASDEECMLTGFSLMMLLETIIERVRQAIRLIENPPSLDRTR